MEVFDDAELAGAPSVSPLRLWLASLLLGPGRIVSPFVLLGIILLAGRVVFGNAADYGFAGDIVSGLAPHLPDNLETVSVMLTVFVLVTGWVACGHPWTVRRLVGLPGRRRATRTAPATSRRQDSQLAAASRVSVNDERVEDAPTPLDWTGAERILAAEGFPHVARFLRLVAALDPARRDRLEQAVHVDAQFKLAAHEAFDAAASLGPAVPIERVVARAIGDRPELAGHPSDVRATVLIAGVALAVKTHLEGPTWHTLWTPFAQGLIPYSSLWAEERGEPEEFRSDRARAALEAVRAETRSLMAEGTEMSTGGVAASSEVGLV